MNDRDTHTKPIELVQLPKLSQQNDLVDPFAKDVYSCFIAHFYNTGTRLIDLKIFEAIQATAITMEISNAFAAKTLVELGLRAPRKAFPASFLDFADKACRIKSYKDNIAPASPAITALTRHWHRLRENPDILAFKQSA